MKKNLLFGLLVLSVCSCTKSFSDNTTAPETLTSVNKKTSVSKKNYARSKITERYSGNYFDSCRQENIILTGTVTYTTKESFSNGYYLTYNIELKATGIGERTGKSFHGGIKQKATVKTNVEGDTRSIINYKLRFISKSGEHITFTQIARFVSMNGQTKVSFDNISDSCK